MSYFIVSLVVITTITLSSSQAFREVVDCEKITINRCYIGSERIFSSEFIFLRKHENIVSIDMNDNKNIRYLPINTAEMFPNLIVYQGSRCSIKAIHKINFQNLTKTETLALPFNYIETIEGNTFEEMISLTHLDLQNNRIKHMNGRALDVIINVQRVILINNICIDKDFDDDNGSRPEVIAEMPSIVQENCGFCDMTDILSHCDVINNFKSTIRLMLRSFQIRNQLTADTKIVSETSHEGEEPGNKTCEAEDMIKSFMHQL
ncbi:CLUMA_CG007544, isoform A [Clunio marinus]|uniref:CLUMA_CG007544, isoform A n=1 Tax=Clunio marinus TaxID=568069 RepID=A0A1J1I1D7_9DIPT|nr:CLUMA_CG007544, isoform A [Clunio marinus]